MALKYDTQEQAAMRLQGTVITYRDKAVWVREVYNKDGKPHIYAQPFPIRSHLGKQVPIKEEAMLRLPADDPELNFRLFRLGYLNDATRHTAFYVTRQPRRQQGQGLGHGVLNNIHDGTFWTQAFEDMLFGKYPTPASAQDMLQSGEWYKVAISRDFAVARDDDFSSLMKLYYRDAPVGISLSNSKFELAPKFSFLKEVASENNIPFTLA